MYHMRRHYRFATLFLAVAACSSGSGSDWVTPTPAAGTKGTAIHITGVVHHVDVEGGFYAIRGDDGATYDPTNLPPEFQKEGLSVEAEARRRHDMMGTHMTGSIVELARIRKR
jgi:hypothetical protein